MRLHPNDMCQCPRPVDSGRRYGGRTTCIGCNKYVATAREFAVARANLKDEREQEEKRARSRVKGGLQP